MKNWVKRIHSALRQAKATWDAEPIKHPEEGDWQEGAGMTEDQRGQAVMAMMQPGPEKYDFDPEEYAKKEFAWDKENSISPHWLMQQVESKKAEIGRAHLFQGRINGAGKLLKEGKGKDWRIKTYFGNSGYEKAIQESNAAVMKLKESFRANNSNLREDYFGQDGALYGPYDPNQYTEYAPLLGGYFYAQMYLTDMLKQMAYGFEAWNHNPVAHRIIDGLAQYTLGRRFDWRIKDSKKKDVWEYFAENNNLRHRLSKYWVREKLITGELMINRKNWTSIHPATVWEIVTDPLDIANVYYYYRSYPTQYQMYTGYNVGGGGKAPGQKYIIEQLPYQQIIHIKGDCTSWEKRGRSKLFPVLGWMKRIKDLYQAQVTREQMQADYAWDVTIKGSPAAVSAFQNSNLCIPKGTGNTFVHNEAIIREPMAVAPTRGGAGSSASDAILAYIATAIGFPKDFFNVIATGSGGGRATALVGAEPFTKVVEENQADIEHLLQQIVKAVFEENGLEYSEDDVEFIFPSVTKDTTTETIKNIQVGEMQGYISKETAGAMYGQEMNITSYNYDEEQGKLQQEMSRGDTGGGVGIPDGRLGTDNPVGGPDGSTDVILEPGAAPGGNEEPEPSTSPIHGVGKLNMQADLNRI